MDVVVVKLAQIDALFTEIRRIYVETAGLEHEFYALRRRAIVLDEKHSHAFSLSQKSPFTWRVRA